jgi:molybdate transport system substrate-binding protein
LALAGAALAVAALTGCRDDKDDTVKLYAGAGLRRGVSELVVEFEQQTGIRVEPDYGGSGVQVGRVKMGAEADLFMPGDVGYVDMVADLIESRTQVSWFVPTIIVAKGNLKKIDKLADFFKPDVKVALGNPKACRIGQLNDELFTKNGLDWRKIPQDNLMLSTTVNELGVWVKSGTVDASIVWGAIAANIADDADRKEIPKDKNVISSVVVGLMKRSRRKAKARRFMEFITSEKGQAILKKNGYRTQAP